MNYCVRTALAFGMCIVMGSGIAHAQASRTWVSGVGDDADPCSRTAPCKTFAGAIANTAPGGEISVLDPGGYGAVSITQSVTIDGDGTLASILTNSGNGIVVNGAGAVLTLRNISLISTNGGGLKGVQLLNGSAAILDHVTISGFETAVSSTTGNVMVINSTLVRNRGFAVHALGGTITVENSMLANNGVAVQAESGATINLSNDGIYNNLTGFGCGGGILATANNNRKANNTGGVAPVCATNAVISLK
jgi:hypothetical protein